MAALLHLLASAETIPCEASEHGCPKSPVEEWVALAVVAGALLSFVLMWAWTRWDRGPFAWLARRRRRRREERLF